MLTHISPDRLDAAWEDAARLLQPALDKSRGEMTPDQLRLLIVQGRMQLIVGGDPMDLACACEFKNYPNFRVCQVAYLGGRLSRDDLGIFRQWAADHGASALECWCGDAEARLFHRYGFVTTYHLMRAPL